MHPGGESLDRDVGLYLISVMQYWISLVLFDILFSAGSQLRLVCGLSSSLLCTVCLHVGVYSLDTPTCALSVTILFLRNLITVISCCELRP